MLFYTMVTRGGESRADREAARGEALARLFERAGLPADAVVAKDGRGRPYLPAFPDRFISISHAPSVTVAAISDAPLGVDGESPASIRDPMGLARRYFTDDERADAVDPDAICRIWTKKEAYAKYTGLGLAETYGVSTCSIPCEAAFYTVTHDTDRGIVYLTFCAHEPPQALIR